MAKLSKEQYKSGKDALTTKQVKELLLTFKNLQEKDMLALAV